MVREASCSVIKHIYEKELTMSNSTLPQLQLSMKKLCRATVDASCDSCDGIGLLNSTVYGLSSADNVQ